MDFVGVVCAAVCVCIEFVNCLFFGLDCIRACDLSVSRNRANSAA